MMGNPVNGGRIGLDITNEDNENFTVVINSIVGNATLFQKDFVNTGSNQISIDIPPQIQEGNYILTIYSATTKISKQIFIIR